MSDDWKVGNKFNHQLNGYPITRNGSLIAIAVYAGGTEAAKDNAELIVKALLALSRPHSRSDG